MDRPPSALAPGGGLSWLPRAACRQRHPLRRSTCRRARVNLLRRADITRLGELVLVTEAAFLALRPARREDWTAVQVALQRAGIERDTVPLVYVIWSSSRLMLLFHHGIRRVGDLLALTETELRALPNMSASDVGDVQRALACYGLQVQEE